MKYAFAFLVAFMLSFSMFRIADVLDEPAALTAWLVVSTL